MNDSKIKKHLVSAIAVTFFLFIAFGSDDDKTTNNSDSLETTSESDNPQENPNNKAALAEIFADFNTGLIAVDAEPKIYEAVITDIDVLYVSVKDNGVSQDRFAQTLCNYLKKHKASTSRVKVVKVGATYDNDYKSQRLPLQGKLLGESHCN
jgi:hypothetical protein